MCLCSPEQSLYIVCGRVIDTAASFLLTKMAENAAEFYTIYRNNLEEKLINKIRWF
jgi:hypothetical protein